MNTRGVYGLIFLLTIVLAAAVVIRPVTAQTIGVAASPARINLGTLAQGQQGTSHVKIYNPSNTSQLNYSTTLKGLDGSVTPSSGVIAAKSNQTVTVTGHRLRCCRCSDWCFAHREPSDR